MKKIHKSYTYKKCNHKEQSSLSMFSIFVEAMEFRLDDFKMFISTL